jgi:ring-1,2-phenylacetyl-CoA epoxidase subunit PaaD
MQNSELKISVNKSQPSDVWKLLSEIPDPEIPVITIVDLGIVREVLVKLDSVIVEITPTYSGCPAYDFINQEIISKLKGQGFENVEIKMRLSPAWTTDWMSDEAKEKLRKYGIAPPEKSTSDKNILLGKSKNIVCPHCGSDKTEMISMFGSTACKAIYRCNNCTEPFDYFKCI